MPLSLLFPALTTENDNKSEIRSPKLETNSNDKNSNVQNRLGVLDLENLDFDIVSDFDIRISNLTNDHA